MGWAAQFFVKNYKAFQVMNPHQVMREEMLNQGNKTENRGQLIFMMKALCGHIFDKIILLRPSRKTNNFLSN